MQMVVSEWEVMRGKIHMQYILRYYDFLKKKLQLN